MREMILNHASLASPDRRTAVTWLTDVTIGIALLTQRRIVESTLRMHKPHHEALCMADWSLWDALLEMRKGGAREEFRFFSSLTSKVPLLIDIGPDIKDRFRECEAKTLPSPDGDPLVLAAVTDGVGVGFPSEPVWDKSSTIVAFDELLLDGSIAEASETIDNLTRSAHAKLISERHRIRVRDGLREFRSGARLWKTRKQAFRHLLFGLDVETHLTALNPGDLVTVVNKLAILDDSVGSWRSVGGPVPPWGTKVTDESDSVKKNHGLRELRRFRASDGKTQLYTWHARFGSSGRIHLRFNAGPREVEIGYIGQHLKLK